MRRRYLITAAVALAAAGVTVGADARDADDPAEAAQARRGGRRSCSTSACGPTRRRSRCAARPISTTPARCDQAAPLFGRYRSLEAEVGSALAAWPHGFGGSPRWRATHPRSSLVQLALRARRSTGAATRRRAKTAWRAARRAQPDTPYALRAEDLLHPNFPRGLPTLRPELPPAAGASRGSRRRSSSTTCARTRPTCAGKLLLRRRAPAARPAALGAARVRGGAGSRPTTRSRRSRAPSAASTRPIPSRTFSRLGPLAKRYPAEPERPLPPRPLPALARQRERRRRRSSGSPATPVRRPRWAPRRAASSSGCQ